MVMVNLLEFGFAFSVRGYRLCPRPNALVERPNSSMISYS
jgi:hypothetical protein